MVEIVDRMRSVTKLRKQVRGGVHVSDDPLYASLSRGSGATPVHDRRPGVVVLPVTAEDIARTLEFAEGEGLEVSIRSGGHDALGASTTRDGVLIDLCRMNAVSIEAGSRIAVAGAGARSGDLGRAAGPHGLAPVLGMNPTVGLGGVTLGGGIGWLCGSHGATVDTVLAVDLVTADGRLLRADTEQNEDLFWALRGGGGNFGVATAFHYKLPPIGPVTAGTILFQTDIAPFLRFVRDFLADSPDALDIAAGVSALGGSSGFVRVCWAGDPTEGDRVLRPLRAFAPAVFDGIQVQSFMDFTLNSPVAHFDNMYWRGGEVDGLSDDVIEAIAELIKGGTPEDCTIWLLHYMHGALCRVPFDSTPLLRPKGHILYNICASWTAVPPPQAMDWVRSAAAVLADVRSDRTYVNYLSDDDDQAVRKAFGANFDRLQAIKRRYDPENLFRNNRNILP